jgi:tRNA-modifying protein YgfZ
MDKLDKLNVDQSHWECVRVSGSDRVRFIQGMCTADVAKLQEGDWGRGAMLNVKGRVVSVFDVVVQDDTLLLLCEPGLGEKTQQVLGKHAIMDDVEFRRERVQVHRVWEDPATAWDAAPRFGPCPDPVATHAQVEARRIEAGIPRYGLDVSEDDFPFESRLREYIDYKKGCYLGQEPIARVQAQGRPNRALMILRFKGDQVVRPGSVVAHADRPHAGTVTSSALSAEFGSLALAYLHRTVAEPGTVVTVEGRPGTVAVPPLTP